MLQQLNLDTSYADATLDDGTHVFALRDPITAPKRHTLLVRLLNAWLPHSYYNIFEENDALVLKLKLKLKLKLFTTLPVRTGCRLWAPPFAMPYRT
jgi:hypothetical protein